MSDITSPVDSAKDESAPWPDRQAERIPVSEANLSAENLAADTAGTTITLVPIPAAETFARWEKAVYLEVYNNLWSEARSANGRQLYVVEVPPVATQSQRPQPGFKFRPATINDARIDMLCNPCSYRCFLKKFLSPTLRNARAKGWWIFWTLILPQAMNYLVFPESLTHLLSVVVLLTLSVVNLGFRNLSCYHIVCFVILLFWLAGVIVHIIVAIVCRKRMCCRYQQVRYQQLQLAPLQEQNTTHSGTSHSTSRKLDNHFHIGYLMFVELCAYSLLIFSLIGAIASKLNGLKSGALVSCI